MKPVQKLLGLLVITAMVFSCQKAPVVSQDPSTDFSTVPTAEQKKYIFQLPDIANTAWTTNTGSQCASPYEINLLQRTQQPDGTWLWIWGVRNPKPGDGTNGTIQDLTHWSMQLPECIKAENIKLAKSAYYNQLFQYFFPVIGPDAAYTNCPPGSPDVTGGATNLLRFKPGTLGSDVSVYALVLDKEYPVDPNAVAYYKSGCNPGGTGTGKTCFPGIGCPKPEPCVEGCSYSQGRYFSNNDKPWPTPTVTVGGKTYTQAEGRAIWKSSNQGGISDAKKSFHQVAAIKLSGSSVGKCAKVWADVKIIEDWLSTLPKLTPTNHYEFKNKAAAEAAGRIGSWIEKHHCGEGDDDKDCDKDEEKKKEEEKKKKEEEKKRG